jgi:predicted phage terminase large subunit-like protein
MDASSWTLSQLLKHAWRATPASFAERVGRGTWRRRPHLDLISEIVAEAAHRGGQRILVSAPPRHGKSELLSKNVPAWFLDLYPDRRVISCSYAATIARRWGRHVRNLAAEHSADLRFQLAPDSQAADAWDTVEGGGMTTAGVGGPITGLGAHLMLIDDPIKNWKDAYSETVRDAVWDWWLSTASTRLEPGASVVLLMTRWHDDDLAGRLLRQAVEDPESEQWTEVVLPAIAEDHDPLGRAPGEALWPERYSAATLRQIERRVGPAVWEALYQGRPRKKGGGFFPADRWANYEPHDLLDDMSGLWVMVNGVLVPQRWERMIASWDCTFKETATSDYVVGGVWGLMGANAYLLDLWRDRADVIKTMAAMEAQAAKWRPRGLSGIYVEDKANGPAIMRLLRNSVGGLVGVEPDGPKVARAQAASPFQQGGNLYLPARASWRHGFVAECEAFPSGRNDDQVDMLTQAVRVLGLGGAVAAAGPSALDRASPLGDYTPRYDASPLDTDGPLGGAYG